MAKLTFKQFQQKVNRWAKENPKAVEEALAAGALMVSGEAVEKHLSGPTSAGGGFFGESLSVGKRKGLGGTLRRSISERIKGGKNPSATVGTNVVYAPIHEYGLGRMPQRPFLRPSLEKRRKDVMELILRKIMEAFRRGN